MLAFAATARPPFTGDSAATVMFRLVSEPPELTGLADEELTGLIGSCLAKAPETRPTVAQVLAALSGPGPAPLRADASGTITRRAADGATTTQAPAGTGATMPPGLAGTGPDQPSGRRPRRWAAALIATAALAVALGVTLPVLLAGSSPRAADSSRPGVATSTGATIRPSLDRPSPVVSIHRQTPTPAATSMSPSPAARPSTSLPASSPASASPPLVDVPDTIGMTTSQAIQRLEAAGFAGESEQIRSIEKVFDYNPVGKAPRGSTITIDTGF